MPDCPDWHSLLPRTIEDLLAPIRPWINAEPDAVIPSLALGGDGRYLKSVFFVFGDILCETRLTGRGADVFDFVRLDHVLNLRVKRTVVSVGEGASAQQYQTAEVLVAHTSASASELTYVGDDDVAWLAVVRQYFNVHLLTCGGGRQNL